MRLEIAGSVRLGKFRRRLRTKPGDLDGRFSRERRSNELVSGRIIERYWVLSQRPSRYPEYEGTARVPFSLFSISSIANTCCPELLPLTKIPRMIQIMPLAEPEPPKTKLGESFIRLVKATTTYVGVEIVKRFVPASFLRSLDDFKKGRVVSDDVALNTTPPKM